MSKDIYKNLPVFAFAEEIKKQHPKKKLNCLIFGNFGAMNSGDEAILAGELAELQKLGNVTATVVARYPEVVKRIHGVSVVSFFSIGAILQAIQKADFVIVGGGGIICKVERGIIGFVYQLSMLLLFYFFPKIFRKKIYTLGIGVYDNTNPLLLRLAMPLLRFSSILTVRDYHSAEILAKYNVRAQLRKDNSYLLQLAPKQEVGRDPFFKKLYDKKRANIGISLLKPDAPHEEKHLLAQMSEFIVRNQKNTDFWFFAADHHPSYFNDEKFGKELHRTVSERIGKQVSFHFVPTDWHPRKFFAALQFMDSLVTMRLHPGIFAHRLNVPFVGITYDRKTTSFLESIGKKPLHMSRFSWKQLNSGVTE